MIENIHRFDQANTNIVNSINEEVLEIGYKMSLVPISHIKDLSNEFEKRHDNHYIDIDFYTTVKDFFNFTPPNNIQNISSIISVAAPSPKVKVFFNRKGEKLSVFLPPTYVDHGEKFTEIDRNIAKIFNKYNHNIIRASLPEKLLAVQSGLGFYGKNNICYVPGMGSYIFLSAYYTDLACAEDTWNDIRQMDSCEKCLVCRKNCPTGAITSERFLLKVDRCLTYHNEFTGICDFPEWINPLAHNCIVGCLYCQDHCPQNKEFINNIVELESFDEEETLLIEEGKKLEDLPATLVSKIQSLHLLDYYDLLPRNLRVLFDKAV